MDNEVFNQQNRDVDDLCGCPGKEKTRSRRIMKNYHENWCFYYLHLEDQMKESLKRLQSDLSDL